MRTTLSLLLAATLAPVAYAGANDVVYKTYTADIMYTTNQVVLPDVPGSAEAAEAVFAAFRDVDAKMSEWKSTSPLSAVNAAAGTPEPVPIPADLLALLQRGVEIGALTDGAFDITWAALWGLWDFKAEKPVVPPAQEIANRVKLVDYRRVVIAPKTGTVRLPEAGMKIGLGGIAKGFALDQAGVILRERGFTSFLVMAGGQALAGGLKNGRKWRIGIRDPRGAPEDYFAFLDVTDVSVSTSGDYESFFIVDGIRYHHIMDPKTGRPSKGLRSTTVVTPDATLADALSTAFMVMGKDRAIALATELGVEAVLVDDKGAYVATDGLRDRLAVKHLPKAS